jgi:cell wall-associated NlpC family hydrolase
LAASPTSRPDRALEHLTHRAKYSRMRYTRRHPVLQALSGQSLPSLADTILRRTPPRLWLHLVIVVLVPLAWVVSQALPEIGQTSAEVASVEVQPERTESTLLPVGPIPLSQLGDDELGELPVPDSAFAEIVALPEAQLARSRQDILAPTTYETVVVGDQVNVRNGPGLVYDKIGELAASTPLLLEAYVEDWFVARTAAGEQVWIAAELVANSATARTLLAPATAVPPPPPPKIAVVGEEGLNLRDGPGTAYVKLDSLAQGTTIDLLSRYENWFEVRHPSGTIGWVTGNFLQIADGVSPRLEVLTAAPDPNPALVATADGTVNLRGGPGTAYPKVTSVSGGTQLELVARYQEWLKVRTADGKSAWVFNDVVRVSDYVVRRVPATRDIPALPRPSAPAVARPQSGGRSAPALSAAQAGSVVNFAMQFRGVPYVWGGASPKGFDCSGFTKYVYAQFGLNLPHSAAGQYSQRYGVFIDQASLQPGDLVFFANTYKRGISHVGVYVGGGMVVQALAPGTPLAAVSMNSAYWNSKYYGALRPNL